MTSPAEQITIECPDCGHRQTAWYRPSVNAALDPDLDIEKANTTTCPKCECLISLGGLVVSQEHSRWEVRA